MVGMLTAHLLHVGVKPTEPSPGPVQASSHIRARLGDDQTGDAKHPIASAAIAARTHRWRVRPATPHEPVEHALHMILTAYSHS